MGVASLSLYSIFIILAFIPSSDAEQDAGFTECSQPFNCGSFKSLCYPFWGDNRPQYCGHSGYKLRCNENAQHPVMEIDGRDFFVIGINQFGKPRMMTLSRIHPCPIPIPFISHTPTPLNYAQFNILTATENMTLFSNCFNSSLSRKRINTSHTIPCAADGKPGSISFFLRDNETHLVNCTEKVEVPVSKEALDEFNSGQLDLSGTLLRPFNVQYLAYDSYCEKCSRSGGSCGSSRTFPSTFACNCPDGPYDVECRGKATGDDKKWKRKLAIGLGCGFFGGVVITCIVFIFFLRRRRVLKYARSSSVTHDISSAPASLTEYGKGGNFPGVHNFTYNELEKATNKFDSAMELGDGGFGTVYYGTLQDGRPVAVKRLNENNYKRVEQFWNEVEILAQVRHRHLVLLYGYTFRHCRELLLVYEYISNGTVADHLHGERAKPGSLPWLIRLKIAIETASALTYLHATDIIHRDVKTNNILLDENFSVKVADFGISRPFPTHVTHVSTAPQGTPGYVDPEYHECYQLTDKSDVFSFGVVLIELISSKPAVDITRHRHEINLSNMAINKIQNRALHELVDPTLGYESDHKVKTMITAVAEVAFQCLQGGKDLRPTMVEVFKALKGIESGDYNNEKAEGMNVATDEVALLKTPSTTSNASKEKAEEMSVVAGEVVLLKSRSPILSPDSVAVKWISSSTTSFTND
ncbi:hypothetical protein SLA2020_360430 [Shorea laevis]